MWIRTTIQWDRRLHFHLVHLLFGIELPLLFFEHVFKVLELECLLFEVLFKLFHLIFLFLDVYVFHLKSFLHCTKDPLLFLYCLLSLGNFLFALLDLELLLFEQLVVELLLLFKALLSQAYAHKGQVDQVVDVSSFWLLFGQHPSDHPLELLAVARRDAIELAVFDFDSQ